jgi:integral membrane protein
MNEFSLKTQRGRLRIISYAEAISFIALVFVAVPLKHFAGNPQPVRIVGMMHGLLFVLYIFNVIQAKIEYGWSMRTMLLGVLASVVPFGPFVAEAKLYDQK